MDFAELLFSIIANPNVAYVLLVVGLIALVLAFAAPGTGFLEIAAVICLALAVVGLSRLPVNIAGLALIGVGIALFIADIKLQSGLVALGGAVALGLGSLFLFRPGESAVVVSWWLALGVTLATAAFFGFGATRAMRAMRAPVRVGDNNLVGASGVLRSALVKEGAHYVGTALVNGELWSVKSDVALPEGAEVVVTRVEGLTLHVCPQASLPAPRSGADLTNVFTQRKGGA